MLQVNWWPTGPNNKGLPVSSCKIRYGKMVAMLCQTIHRSSWGEKVMQTMLCFGGVRK